MRGPLTFRVRREPCGTTAACLLGADVELLDQVQIAVAIRVAQVLEERRAPADLHEQAAPRREVLGVGLQMVRQRTDLRREQGDLHFGRTRVLGAAAVSCDQLRLLLRALEQLLGLRHGLLFDRRRGRRYRDPLGPPPGPVVRGTFSGKPRMERAGRYRPASPAPPNSWAGGAAAP